jgi:hypothetical protein
MKGSNFLTCLFLSITGIKKSSEEYKINKDNKCTDILLCVSSMLDDVKISSLSDEDIEEVWFRIYATAYRWKIVASANIFYELEAVIAQQILQSCFTYSKYSLFSFLLSIGLVK